MLELTFITSSKEKLSHAKYLSRDVPVKIVKQRNYGIGYIEPRIADREELIKRSVADAILRFKKTIANSYDHFFSSKTHLLLYKNSAKKMNTQVLM